MGKTFSLSLFPSMDFIVDLHHRRTAAILPFPVISSFSSNFSSSFSLSLCPHFFHSNLASTKLNFHVSHIHYGSEEILSAPIIIKLHYYDSHIRPPMWEKKTQCNECASLYGWLAGEPFSDFLNDANPHWDDDDTRAARSDVAHVQSNKSTQNNGYVLQGWNNKPKINCC